MQNIKQNVLGVLQNEQNTEAVLNDLSNCQNNLLKNFLKSVVGQALPDKLFNTHI